MSRYAVPLPKIEPHPGAEAEAEIKVDIEIETESETEAGRKKKGRARCGAQALASCNHSRSGMPTQGGVQEGLNIERVRALIKQTCVDPSFTFTQLFPCRKYAATIGPNNFLSQHPALSQSQGLRHIRLYSRRRSDTAQQKTQYNILKDAYISRENVSIPATHIAWVDCKRVVERSLASPARPTHTAVKTEVASLSSRTHNSPALISTRHAKGIETRAGHDHRLNYKLKHNDLLQTQGDFQSLVAKAGSKVIVSCEVLRQLLSPNLSSQTRITRASESPQRSIDTTTNATKTLRLHKELLASSTTDKKRFTIRRKPTLRTAPRWDRATAGPPPPRLAIEVSPAFGVGDSSLL